MYSRLLHQVVSVNLQSLEIALRVLVAVHKRDPRRGGRTCPTPRVLLLDQLLQVLSVGGGGGCGSGGGRLRHRRRGPSSPDEYLTAGQRRGLLHI